MSAFLEVNGLYTSLALANGTLNALSDVSFELERGETLGIVGESGSGKSMTVMSLMGLLPSNAQVKANTMRLGNIDLLAASHRELAALRGDRMAMIFQEPMTSLNPVYSIGRQMTEGLQLHRGASQKEARKTAIGLLERVGITAAESRLSQYPHQLSGGLRQRVMIAMSLMCDPELLIADEPTTALDVTVQAQILELLHELQRERDMAMILITHDLGVVSRCSDKVAVMYAGQIIETGSAGQIFAAPHHPYTNGLIASIPIPGQVKPGQPLTAIQGTVPSLMRDIRGCRFADRCDFVSDSCRAGAIELRDIEAQHRSRCIVDATQPAALEAIDAGGSHAYGQIPDTAPSVLKAQGVQKQFKLRQGLFSKTQTLTAVRDLDLNLREGEVLALVGESGCGKSTLAKMLLGLMPPSMGHVEIAGGTIDTHGALDLAERVQPVFQDPYSSLNPRRTIGEIIRRPLVLHKSGDVSEQKRRVEEIMQRVGLPERLYHTYPNQLSGGQRQRVAIARALIMRPRVVICDEPTSALDVSVQAQILNLLLELREEFKLTYLLITHDMSVVEHLATRVAVMYLGRLVEEGPARQILNSPNHPYTKALMASVLTPDPGKDVPRSELGTSYPNPINPPSGCAFHPRCPYAQQTCKTSDPETLSLGGVKVACHFPLGQPAIHAEE